jgi:MoaA/NifB/PqqE/SkfB family radical SAM enzyme
MITFSIDGITKEVYEKIRKGGDFEKLLKNLKILNNYRKNKPGKLKTLLNLVVMKSNYHQLEHYIEFAKENEFDCFQISPIEDFKGEENIFLQNNIEAMSYLQKVLPKVFETAEKYGISVINSLPIQIENKNSEIIEIKVAEAVKEEMLCYLPWQYLSICYGGYVAPHSSCRKKIGDVNEYTIDQLWNSEMSQLYRKMTIDGKSKNICNLQCIMNVIPRKYRKLG